jgi:hypothetical protein
MGQPKPALRHEVDWPIEDILQRWDKSLQMDSKVLAAARAAIRSSKALLVRQASESNRRKPRFP